MKLCKDCKWCDQGVGHTPPMKKEDVEAGLHFGCRHDITNPVTGQVKPLSEVSCHTLRTKPSACGIAAHWWEPK